MKTLSPALYFTVRVCPGIGGLIRHASRNEFSSPCSELIIRFAIQFNNLKETTHLCNLFGGIFNLLGKGSANHLPHHPLNFLRQKSYIATNKGRLIKCLQLSLPKYELEMKDIRVFSQYVRVSIIANIIKRGPSP